MLRTIQRVIRRFFSDIKSQRNIEVYIVSLTAIIVAVVGLISDVLPDEVKFAAILAALSLLVFRISVPEAQNRDLDDYLNDRSAFVPLPTLIKGATKLWIYGPSNINILSQDNVIAIRNEILNKPDGEFRVLIQDPEEIEALRIAVRQIDENIDFKVQDLPKAIQDALQILGNIDKWPRTGKFEYRLLPFNPGFSMVAVDPDKSTGVVIVEFYGFYHEHTSSRMHIRITRDESERWYTYWGDQFRRMWDKARLPTRAEIDSVADAPAAGQ